MRLSKTALLSLLLGSVFMMTNAEDGHNEPPIHPDEDDDGEGDSYYVVKVVHNQHPVIGASIENEFHSWSVEHNKKYTTEAERHLRLQNWLKTDDKIRQHNAKYKSGESTYYMGHNEYSDMTPEEFAAHFNLHSYVESPLEEVEKIMGISDTSKFNQQISSLRTVKSTGRGLRTTSNSVTQDVPEVDWVAAGIVTDVKNQQSCGSCWAFAATAGMESKRALFIEKNGIADADKLVSLSEQEMVDCASAETGNYGCNGGWPKDAIAKYVKANGGLCTEADYPYENTDTNGCRSGGCAKVPYTIFGGAKYLYKHTQNVRDAEQLLAAIQNEPYMLAVIAEPYDEWMSYAGGIFSPTGECGLPDQTPVNHAMLLVGTGTDENGPYYKFKNSWGAGWGDAGFIKFPADPTLKDHDGPCGMLRYIMYALDPTA